ncbi:MAG: FtsW/RodA/SpoVE family cell cycle protein [Chloroflexi bacterium]|nr:FtsW/RodA/SpoVE family cell cycle protein [Chloroflexota bacterium]
MIVAGVVILTYGLILTLAPAIRYHAGLERFQFQHWIGILAWFLSFSVLHHQTQRHLPESDPYLLPLAALLSGIGLLTIWRLFPSLGLRQMAWLVLACLLGLIVVNFPRLLQFLRRYKYIWLVLGLLLTGLTIFLGTNPQGEGSTRWLYVFGIHFQPSEPLKLLLIAYLAGFFTDQLTVRGKQFEVFLPTLVVTGLALMHLIFQGDLGTAIIFMLIYLAMLFTSGGSLWVFWLTPVLIAIAGLAGYMLTDIVQLRIDAWLKPFSDPTGATYQVVQSMIAIAEGNLIGTGAGLGSPGLIPVAVSDFIFSALAEELGLLGIAAVIVLFFLLIYRGIKIAASTNNSFYRHLSLGLTFYFGIQGILIIGGNIGLLPLTGVTLPLLSYGGSSLVVSFLGVLTLLTISHQPESDNQTKTIPLPRYALIGVILVLFFIIEIIGASLLSFWFSPALVDRPENPRWIIDDRFVQRGEIVDRDNQTIITNTGITGNFSRTSDHIPLYPVIGYTDPVFGQTGIEATMFNYLRGKIGYTFATQFRQRLLYNQPPKGLDVRLTIDLGLQRSADDLLEGYQGAIVIMNAASGEILTMASHPYFDAAYLQEDWDTLLVDETAPLLNRATQGLYPPGATLFPFIIIDDALISTQLQEPEDRLTVKTADLNCALKPQKPLTWQSIIANGCQTAQMTVAADVGSDALINLYADLGFFTSPQLHLPVADAAASNTIDLNAFFSGEGNFKLSPLQMTMAVSTLSNQGVLPGPRIVNAYNDPVEGWSTLPKLQANVETFDAVSINRVNNLLRQSNYPYWQVVSTVMTEDQQPVTWFIAGTSADWQGQPIATVVVLELDAPSLAESIGRALIEEAIQFLGQAQ